MLTVAETLRQRAANLDYSKEERERFKKQYELLTQSRREIVSNEKLSESMTTTTGMGGFNMRGLVIKKTAHIANNEKKTQYYRVQVLPLFPFTYITDSDEFVISSDKRMLIVECEGRPITCSLDKMITVACFDNPPISDGQFCVVDTLKLKRNGIYVNANAKTIIPWPNAPHLLQMHQLLNKIFDSQFLELMPITEFPSYNDIYQKVIETRVANNKKKEAEAKRKKLAGEVEKNGEKKDERKIDSAPNNTEMQEDYKKVFLECIYNNTIHVNENMLDVIKGNKTIYLPMRINDLVGNNQDTIVSVQEVRTHSTYFELQQKVDSNKNPVPHRDKDTNDIYPFNKRQLATVKLFVTVLNCNSKTCETTVNNMCLEINIFEKIMRTLGMMHPDHFVPLMPIFLPKMEPVLECWLDIYNTSCYAVNKNAKQEIGGTQAHAIRLNCKNIYIDWRRFLENETLPITDQCAVEFLQTWIRKCGGRVESKKTADIGALRDLHAKNPEEAKKVNEISYVLAHNTMPTKTKRFVINCNYDCSTHKYKSKKDHAPSKRYYLMCNAEIKDTPKNKKWRVRYEKALKIIRDPQVSAGALLKARKEEQLYQSFCSNGLRGEDDDNAMDLVKGESFVGMVYAVNIEAVETIPYDYDIEVPPRGSVEIDEDEDEDEIEEEITDTTMIPVPEKVEVEVEVEVVEKKETEKSEWAEFAYAEKEFQQSKRKLNAQQKDAKKKKKKKKLKD